MLTHYIFRDHFTKFHTHSYSLAVLLFMIHVSPFSLHISPSLIIFYFFFFLSNLSLSILFSNQLFPPLSFIHLFFSPPASVIPLYLYIFLLFIIHFSYFPHNLLPQISLVFSTSLPHSEVNLCIRMYEVALTTQFFF